MSLPQHQMTETVAEAVALVQTGTNEFTSRYNVEYSGPGLENIGFGGFCIAFGINAAAASRLPHQADFNVYSVTGYFTAVAMTTQPLRAEVAILRDSRAFATRRVDLYQDKGGKKLLVMPLTVDFQAHAPISLLTFSAPSFKRYTSPNDSLTDEGRMAYALRQGATEQEKNLFRSMVPHMKRKSERRVALELSEDGTVKNDLHRFASVTYPPSLPAKHGIDEPVTEQTYCHWFQFGKPMHDHLSHVLTLAYVADAGSPVVGPAFARVKRRDIAASASLDFALRIFTTDLDLNQWIMREERVVAAGDGRTFTEARMFNESGTMVAQLSEQCLLRASESAVKSSRRVKM